MEEKKTYSEETLAETYICRETVAYMPGNVSAIQIWEDEIEMELPNSEVF